jgi:hypothetical protein
MPEKILLLKCGNRLVVSPTTPQISRLLTPELSFTARRNMYGPEAKIKKQRIELVEYACWVFDH